MFFTYLGRELMIRRRQTTVVVIGMSLAIALVIVVSALASGVRDAQEQALDSVYGVGTDITVSQTAQPGSGGRQEFRFGAEAGTATDQGQALSSSRLSTSPRTQTFDSADLAAASEIDHVAGAAAVLSLENVTFRGEIPDFSQGPPQGGPPTGGADGAGGSAFGIDRTTVLGVDPADDAVGPLTTVSVTEGRSLTAEDAQARVAVVDSVFATTQGVAVGDSITLGGADVEVVGVVGSTTGESVATSSDVYLPLETAQSLSGLTGQVSQMYVQADSNEHVDDIDAALAATFPDATVSTQADLADSVTGSLSTVSDLLARAGAWLSIGALAAAFALAILFTVSGVGRRTRELGTLKAIGWGDRRVVGQVAGESVATGLVAGLVGLLAGVLGVLVINAMGITLSGSAAAATTPAGPPPGFTRGPAAQVADVAEAAVDIVITAPLNVTIIVGAVGLALFGGLLAGVFGGRRAARLSPAEALRSVA